MILLLFVSRNGTNLFDVIKNKNEKCEAIRKAKNTTEKKLSDSNDNDEKFRVLTNGVNVKLIDYMGKLNCFPLPPSHSPHQSFYGFTFGFVSQFKHFPIVQ